MNDKMLPKLTRVKWVAKPDYEGKIYAYDTGFSFDYLVIWDNGTMGKHRESELIVINPNEMLKDIL